MKKILAAIGLLLILQNSWALDIDSAKAQGLVGEANTGYLAAVQPSPSAEVRALIAEVNAKRKSIFENTARKRGITVAQVAAVFYASAVENTAPGHYYQDSNGRWQRK